MTSRCHRFAMVLFALVLSACGGRDVIGPSPTPQSPTQPPPDLPALFGDITLKSTSPEPGAIVPARPCAEDSTRFCSDQPEVTIEVVVDRDLEDVVMTVRFDHCGFASTPPFGLSAHVPAVIRLSRIDLSEHGLTHDGVGSELLCTLPAVTRQVIVSLWRRGYPQNPLLRRDFDATFTFARP